MRIPGEESAFGPGFLRAIRDSKGSGCMLLVFVSVGLGSFLFGVAGTWGPFKDGLRANGDPRFFYAMMAFGAVFGLIALRMLQIVLTAARQAGERRDRSNLQRPWESDYPWKPEGQRPDYEGNTGAFLLGYIGFFGLIGLFNLVFTSPSPWLLRGIVLLVDLFALAILLDGLRKLWQASRHGRPRMRWTTFPAFLGDRLEGVFLISRALRQRGPVKAILRCVQDSGGSESSEPFVIYQQTREIDAAGDVLRELPVAFDVPPDLPGTDLYRGDATYWQVFLQVPVIGPDFEVIFLAPVYERKEGV